VRLGVCVLTSIALLAPATALAQGSYRAVPSGGRSALMGNTGVALARDGAAPFLNPATIASIADPKLALSVNLYSLTQTSVEHFHDPRGTSAGLGRQTLSDARLDPVPSTFCLFLTLGSSASDTDAARRKLAACAGTTERRELSAAASATGTAPDGRRSLHIASISRSYGRVHVGPTYGVALSDTLALGASLHLVNTRVTALANANESSFIPADGGGGGQSATSSLTTSATATSFDIAALLGATLRVDRATTLGVAVGPPSVHVGGEIDVSDDAQRTGLPEGGLGRTRAGTGRFQAPVPMRLAFGLGTHGRRTRVEVDATYFFPMRDAFRSDLDVHSVTNRGDGATDRNDLVVAATDTRGVLDSAIGAEVFVTESLSVLGGFATDFGGIGTLTPTPELGNVVTMREDRAIATLGVGSYGGGSELLVGAQLAFARGEISVADTYALPPGLAPARETTTTVLLVVAGSTNLSNVRKTVEDLRRRLR
jgi:hypothetical protein